MLLCLVFTYVFYLPSILIVKSHNDNAIIFILQNILLGIVTYHITGSQIEPTKAPKVYNFHFELPRGVNKQRHKN